MQDKDGRFWLPIGELLQVGVSDWRSLSVLQIDGRWWEIDGYSDKRRALWVSPVIVEGAAADIGEKLKEYLDQLQQGSSPGTEDQEGTGS